MQPMNLKAIARDATQRGDSKTLFHALDLAFNDFCTELDELRLHGACPRPLRSINSAGVRRKAA
jgi:hypothetical protein